MKRPEVSRIDSGVGVARGGFGDMIKLYVSFGQREAPSMQAPNYSAPRYQASRYRAPGYADQISADCWPRKPEFGGAAARP